MKGENLSVEEKIEERRKLEEDDEYLASWAKTTGFKENLVHIPENFYFKSYSESTLIIHPILGEIEIECVDYEDVDYGIGSYEYWGAVGYDSQMQREATAVEIVDYEDGVELEDIHFVNWMYNEIVKYMTVTIENY